MFGSDPYHAIKSGRVGAMLQSGGLMPEVTVRELVTLVTGFHPRPLPVDETLKRAGIASFADQRVDKLSGGQTQRVRFALAIVGESDLIVLDEPTTAMDVETRQAFWANMKAEVAEGRTSAVRHALSGGSRPGRRPDHRHQQGPPARGRDAEPDQGAGGRQADLLPPGPHRRAVHPRPACPGQRGDPARPGADPVVRLGPHPVRAPRRGLPAARDRGVRPGPGAGVPRHHRRRRQRHRRRRQRHRRRRSPRCCPSSPTWRS